MLDGVPVRRGARRRARGRPSPRAAPRCRRARSTRWTRDRPVGRVGGAERLEGALGVHVGGVLGEDREDELGDGVQAGVAAGGPVERGELGQHERDEAGAAALERAGPGPGGVGGLRARALAGRRSARSERRPPVGSSRVLLELGERVVEGVVDHDAAAVHAGTATAAACGRGSAAIPSPTSRASRSPQRSSGAAPAAIASSTDCGRSTTGTATAPDGRQRRDPLGLHPAADRDARDAGRRGPAGHAEGRLAEGGLGVDPALAGEHEVGAGELLGEAGRPP